MNVSSSHFFVIQSTPPISDSGLCCKASSVKLQLSSSQSVSSFDSLQMFLASSWNCHWMSSAPIVFPFSRSHDPSPGRVARNVARALDRIVQD